MENLTCGCGGENGLHQLGTKKCFRYLVTEEKELPKNKRLAPDGMFKDNNVFIWDIGDHWVTDYTLFNQRMYAKHGDKWSRPKSKDSVNSIEFN